MKHDINKQNIVADLKKKCGVFEIINNNLTRWLNAVFFLNF